MNRLIILGNGFDLAHKMETRYHDFILWYLKEAFIDCKQKNGYDDNLISIEYFGYNSFHQDLNQIDDLKILIEFLHDPTSQMSAFADASRYNKRYKLIAKTDFIRNLLKSCSDCNWVDIEHFYYLEVLKLFTINFSKSDLSIIIKDLNQTFENLKAKFHEYIKRQKVNDNFDFLSSQFRSLIEKTIDYKSIHTFNSVEIENIETLINSNKIKINANHEIYPISTMFLNFNYTNTIEKYLQNSFIASKIGHNPQVNYIHGNASSEIIFGFGDELDEQYNKLEKQNNNEFFRHIKSFHYFLNHNYQDLIRFIENDNYEVFIWGHSCGLSDRTLLNMVFENEKCKAIKIFHHKISEAKNNYTELTHEISRHFKNKALMRKLIVPFDKNSYLPQI